MYSREGMSGPLISISQHFMILYHMTSYYPLSRHVVAIKTLKKTSENGSKSGRPWTTKR